MLFTDQLNRKITIPSPPKRVVSLVPSQTELLVDLGLEERLVGVTKFCVHPSHLRKSKTIVGGTKDYRFEQIDQLKPDLIIGNKEENNRDGIETLAQKYPVWLSDISSLKENNHMILELGKIFQVSEKAESLVKEINSSFEKPMESKGSAVYLIWNKPLMAAGQSTFIDFMLKIAGFTNATRRDRYPEITDKELKSLSPNHLLLSSEPFPFKRKHIDYFQSLLPNTKIKLVDGEMFSWYGSRLLKSADYFRSLK
ncbi:ABC transporter substrate-binding protein [Algoriphagus sediminis]|uniref:Helical backbone metal receptor n=1 Tax=Algoriphagus sediminis TaxID=3057113 RepID=A0ABT7YG37_9BACT|nr:helical backbone metal receptor [Algoriphagus sediminis]MDN3205169.1 helical backbone metal receptor [Algoriphagus sediminis]